MLVKKYPNLRNIFDITPEYTTKYRERSHDGVHQTMPPPYMEEVMRVSGACPDSPPPTSGQTTSHAIVDLLK